MANKILNTPMDGTPKQISFANHAGDFAAAASVTLEEGTPTDCELDLQAVANGAAEQSAKCDLGAHYAERYALVACIEMFTAVAAGVVIEFYWNSSSSATAANANMGAASGATGAYSGYSADLDEAVQQLIYIGSVVLTDDTASTIQTAYVGDLFPPMRYGSLIVKNESGQALANTDTVETHVVLNPIIPELQ